ALTGLFLVLGTALGGMSGAIVALVFAAALNFGTYWFSDRLALRMAGAKEVTAEEAPELHAQVAHLAMLARLPMPKVCIIDTETPNAFATGRNPEHAAVAVTTGIQNLLTKDELAGVIAHELAHIRNRDTLIATIVGAVAGAITWIAHMIQFSALFGGLGGNDEEQGAGGMVGALFVAILAPIAAAMIQMAISRSREFQADATGARILGDPLPLARALEKLHEGVARRPLTRGNPATAHFYIVNPFNAAGVSKLFSTHPPVEQRVARLQEMALRPI
ncbi:MAG: protease HtpX, partial [Chloroflexi bacterium]